MPIKVRPASSFVLEKLIRGGGKELSPILPQFDPDSLQSALKAATSSKDQTPTPMAQTLMEFGAWTAESIRHLDAQRRAHPVQAMHPIERIEVMLALATAELWRVQRDAREQVQKEMKGKTRIIMDANETLRYGLTLRSPEVIETLINAFTYIVADTYAELRRENDGNVSHSDFSGIALEKFAEYINFSTSYRTLLEMWQQALYRGLTVTRNDATWTIEVPADRAKRAAVGETRKERQLASEVTRAMARIRDGQDMRAPVIVIPKVLASKFKLDGVLWIFESSTQGLNSFPNRRADVARIQCAMHSWIAELAMKPIDSTGTTTRDLLEIWFALREVVLAFLTQNEQQEDGPQSWPLTVGRDLLELHLVQAVGVRQDAISERLNYLIHDGKALTELYGHPLLLLRDREITLFVPGLLHADFERVLVRWLSRYLGGDKKDAPYQQKGHIYENRVRTMLAAATARAALPGSWCIETQSVSLPARQGRPERQFDLLLSFGRFLLVGEVKCSSHPVDPREIADRENLIDGAIDQVHDQIAWIRRHWGDFRDHVNLQLPNSIEKCEILPFVVLDGCYGTGFPVCGVPVLDGVDLIGFIENRFELYRDLQSAQKILPFFLANPPLIQIEIPNCEPRTLSLVDPNLSASIDYKDYILAFHQDDQKLRASLNSVVKHFKTHVGGDV